MQDILLLNDALTQSYKKGVGGVKL
jgi:hypothetical protein